MSQIWRKLRENKDGSKHKLPFKFTGGPASFDQHQTIISLSSNATSSYDEAEWSSTSISPTGKIFIPAGVEKQFFPSISPSVSDPLSATPQYVTSLQQVLDNPKTQLYFLSYLAGSTKQALAAFWLDANNFQKCCMEMVRDMIKQNENYSLEGNNFKLNNFQNSSSCVENSGSADVSHDELIKTENCDNIQRIITNQHHVDGLDDRPNVLLNTNTFIPASDVSTDIKCMKITENNLALIGNNNIVTDNTSSCNLYQNVNNLQNLCAHCEGRVCSCYTRVMSGDDCTVRNKLVDVRNIKSEDCLNDNSLDCDIHQPNVIDRTCMIRGESDLASSLKNNLKSYPDIDSLGVFSCKTNFNSTEQINQASPQLESNANEHRNTFSIISSSKSKTSQLENVNASSNLLSACQASFNSTEVQHLIKEVWRIFERYIAVDADFNCPLSDPVKRSVIEKISKMHLQFDVDCFTEAQEEAFTALESEVPGFVSSEWHLQHQLDLLLRSTVTLSDVLLSHAAFPYFMEYIEQEGGRPLLEFTMAATNFRKQENSISRSHETTTVDVIDSSCESSFSHSTSPPQISSIEGHKHTSPVRTNYLSTSKTVSRIRDSPTHHQKIYSPHPVKTISTSKQCSPSHPPQNSDSALQCQADAMVLYDKYFSLQASQRLGFSDSLRCHVESNICQEMGPSRDCFDTALRIVLYVMDKQYLPGYLHSSLYQGYMSHLVASVKASRGGSARRRSASGSTCSSDVSSSIAPAGAVSATNTLLATDTYTRGPGATLPSGQLPSSLRIDASLIRDPDSLWRRKTYRRLSCGSVSALGRFESSLTSLSKEGEGSGRLARTLRRLANRDEDKARLEHAYAAANHIIADVICVTLDTGNSPANPYHPDNLYDIALEAAAAAAAASGDGGVMLTDHFVLPGSHYASNSNLSSSTLSLASSVSDIPHGLSSFSSPTKSVRSLSKSTSAYNFKYPTATSNYPRSISSFTNSNTPRYSFSKPPSSFEFHKFPSTSNVAHSSANLSRPPAASNFTDLTDSLFGSSRHVLAHSYSLASFDLGTDIEKDLDEAVEGVTVTSVAETTPCP